MIKRPAILILFFLCTQAFSVWAQDSDDFDGIHSKGELPPGFMVTSTEKYLESAGRNDINQSREVRLAQDDFFLKSNFYIDALQFNGNVWINDPIGEYVNKVADKLLAKDPKLRDEIQIYITRFPDVNAFATDQGVICVNIGLIAKLHNEAELAFILGHEIVHYKKKHAMDGYIEQVKISKGLEGYKEMSWNESVSKIHSYSKELEFTADLEGLHMYLETDYDIGVVDGVFDILQFATIPIRNIKFDYTLFENMDVVLPSELKEYETREFDTEAKKEDSESTHPSVEKRRHKIWDSLEGVKGGDKKYLVSEDEFKNVQNLARLELGKLYLMRKQFAKSIYHSFSLLDKRPDNHFLKLNIGQSLYAMSLAKTHGAGMYEEEISDIQGYSQAVHHLFDTLSPSDIRAISLTYNLALKKQYPDDEMLERLIQYSMNEVVENDGYWNAEQLIEIRAKRRRDYEDDHGKDKDSLTVGRDWIWDVGDHPSFKKYYDEAQENWKKKKEKAAKEDEEVRSKSKEEKERLKKLKREGRRGYALGIDKVVIVNPFYVKYDERKKGNTDYMGAEKREISMIESLKKMEGPLNMEIEVLDIKSFKKSDGEKYNDMSILNNWVLEYGAEQPLDYVPTEFYQLQDIVKKYDTQYFMWTGVVSVTQRKRGAGLYVFVLFYFPPLIPRILDAMFSPRRHTFQVSLLYDMSKGRVVWYDLNQLPRHKDTMGLITSQLYSTLQQIRAEDDE